MGRELNIMINFRKINGNLVHKNSIINWNKVEIGKGNVIGPNVIIGTEAQHPYEKSNGKIIDTPNKKDAIRNFPGSGNLSDFQIIIPNKIGGRMVARYINEGSLSIINITIYSQFVELF